MNQSSQNKVMSAGFKIIRADDYPSPRIKIKKSRTNGMEHSRKIRNKSGP